MKTFTCLFAGFDLAGKGLEAAGLTPLNLFEYDAELAAVGQRNSAGTYVVADVRDVDWRQYEAPDWLHASPVCTNASVANPSAGESEIDRQCAEATGRAIEAWRPPVISIENVWGYRNFESFRIICDVLRQRGYGFGYWHLNAADYGVPQTRKRLILLATRGGAASGVPPTDACAVPGAKPVRGIASMGWVV